MTSPLSTAGRPVALEIIVCVGISEDRAPKILTQTGH